MTPLARLLHQRIAAHGPLTIAEYMATALSHPTLGYYTTRDPIGRTGDFVTAPEVSQMFGELLGLWCADAWLRAGRPRHANLVELGPGRGTLMADALRALAGMPDFLEAARVCLVETSPALRQRQADRLAATRADGVAITWCTKLDDVPPGPLFLLANEFFDALPVRQFEHLPDGWHERTVTAAATGDGLAFGHRAAAETAALPAAARAAPVGAVAEACPAAQAITADIARRIAGDGGAALVVDYGTATPTAGDTLQAVRGHAYAPVLAAPGEADLTAHVDFGTLGNVARDAGAAVHGPIAQAGLLRRLGIEARAVRLAVDATDDQRGAIAAALERLIGPREMGTLFLALAITPADSDPPAGFS